MKDRRRHLLALMRKHKLNVQDVADRTGRTVSTVLHWISVPSPGVRGRPIPANTLKLLELELQQEGDAA